MTDPEDATTSALWGRDGAAWSPANRLPDVSCAGYRRGSEPIPEVPVVTNVRDHGAVGDGTVDDTAAVRAAIEATDRGAIRLPAGTYKLTDRLRIDRPGIVLRGDGPARTQVSIPLPLNEIDPDWGSTAGGRRTSNYSWSGGFIDVAGSFGTRKLAPITAPAERGDRRVQVSPDHGLEAGMEVELQQTDTAEHSLCEYLYAGDPGPISDIGEETTVSLVTELTAVDDRTLHLDRPLRFAVRPEWTPVVRSFDPTVTEVGIEGLRVEFPPEPYEGHFTELGYNPLVFRNTAHCWVRNLTIHNADNGPMVRSRFCTLEGLRFTADREPTSGNVGHHGIYLKDDDNHYRNFTYDVQFVHDITVSHAAGNVIASGRGVNLCLDHHRRYPYANVFTDIDCGAADRVWASSGGSQRGRHSASWSTFWNIRGDSPIDPMPGDWGTRVNVIGITTQETTPCTDPDARTWWEPIDPASVRPQNIHRAQRERRDQPD